MVLGTPFTLAEISFLICIMEIMLHFKIIVIIGITCTKILIKIQGSWIL
jgi:hypothetical protein